MNDIILRMDNVAVAMEGIHWDSTATMVTYTMSFKFQASEEVCIPPRVCSASKDDLRSIAAYLRKHIGQDQPHALEDSPVFVTYGLEFQLQALCGSVASIDDGEFALQFMIYCGSQDRSRNSIYLGVQAQLDVAEALRWCDKLDQLASSTPR